MKVCIMHFPSNFLKIVFFPKKYLKNFCMEYYWFYLDAVFTIL